MPPVAAAALAMLALTTAASERAASEGEVRYAFYRDIVSGGGARRLFGARRPEPAWGAACALLDRYWNPRCSGAVIAPHWALTAAHCVTPVLAYVQYNTHSAVSRGDHAPVHSLFRHPEYRVEQRDSGAGPDVQLLHHDVGLVRTRVAMTLAKPPARTPLAALEALDMRALRGRAVDVLGFGRTERAAQYDELLLARLQLEECARAEWRHCVCARGGPDGAAGGVCAGDSGGPVLYEGVQVGVTSMGPVECAARGAPRGSSVLTALAPYAELLRATMRAATDGGPLMVRVSTAAPLRARVPLLLALLLPRL